MLDSVVFASGPADASSSDRRWNDNVYESYARGAFSSSWDAIMPMLLILLRRFTQWQRLG